MIEETHSVEEPIVEISARKAAIEQLCFNYFLETHRHTVTKDPEITKIIADAMPDLMFNDDLGHWIVQSYTLPKSLGSFVESDTCMCGWLQMTTCS